MVLADVCCKPSLSQELIEKDSKYYFICSKCKQLVLTSEAWYDTEDQKQKHFSCLSERRLSEITNSIKEK